MAKVELRMATEEDWWGVGRTALEIYVDGEYVGGGGYGGEPEDNSRGRDYSWVEMAMKALAERLGATVETVEVKV